MNKLTQSMKDNADKAREAAAAGLEQARAKSAALVESGKEKAAAGVEASRAKAEAARERTVDAIDANPLAALAGGLLIGGLIAAFLPHSEREKKIMGDTARKVKDRGKAAFDNAKSAGTDAMSRLGLDKDMLKDVVGDIAKKGAEVAKEAGKAATRKAD